MFKDEEINECLGWRDKWMFRVEEINECLGLKG